MIKIKDKWIRIVGVSIFALFICGYPILSGKTIDTKYALHLVVRVLSFILFWEGNRWVVLRTLFSEPSKKRKTINYFRALPLGIVLNTLLTLAVQSIRGYISTGDWWQFKGEIIQINVNEQSVRVQAIFSAMIMSVVYTSFFYFIYESVYNHLRYKKTKEAQELLEKQMLQSQLSSLKEQINPHFLFNSLNSLSSLIISNPEKAEEFVEEMSRVYRYLLQTNDGQLTTLRKEINFINSYIMLLKTRFGEGFKPSIQIEPGMYDYMLPPMTLQLLVENAVKHNITDIDKPLELRMLTKDEKLIVSNNIQKKTRLAPSNGIGLNNILTKYKLLDQAEVEIGETDGWFTVTLPLISVHKNT